MPRAKGSQGDVEGSALRRVWRTPRKEEAVYVYSKDGVLLAMYKEGHSRICKEVPRVSSVGKTYQHPSLKPIEYGNIVAVPHLGVGFGWSNQSSLKRKHLDLGGHQVFHQIGKSYTTLQSHRMSRGKLHQRNYNCKI